MTLELQIERWKQTPEDLRRLSIDARHWQTRERFSWLYEITRSCSAATASQALGVQTMMPVAVVVSYAAASAPTPTPPRPPRRAAATWGDRGATETAGQPRRRPSILRCAIGPQRARAVIESAGEPGRSSFAFAHSASDTSFDFTTRFYAASCHATIVAGSSDMVLKRHLIVQRTSRAGFFGES